MKLKFSDMVKGKFIAIIFMVCGGILAGMFLWCLFSPITNIQELPNELICQLTGKNGLNDTTKFNVMGTDLGIITKYQGEFRYIFGDTFGNEFTTMEEMDPFKDYAWRSQTMAISNDTDPSNGIMLNDWIKNPLSGNATELFPSQKNTSYTGELIAIPTTAVVIDEDFYIYYMSIMNWGYDGHSWICNNASIAYSSDGEHFFKMNNVSWPGNSNCIQFAFVQDNRSFLSNEIYFLTVPGNRNNGAYLVKVNKTQILNQSAYQYLSLIDENNTPIWSYNMNAALCIIPPKVGELSVMWNEYLEKYIVIYTDIAHSGIACRTAEKLWGPWSQPYLIAHARDYPGLYGAFMHPELVENNGKKIYFILSLWQVYNTFVIRVDLTSLNTLEIQNSFDFLFLVGLTALRPAGRRDSDQEEFNFELLKKAR
ncbi:MAG: DUF4185 domain-containing protein [Candidatus Helarchaeota archaeon]